MKEFYHLIVSKTEISKVIKLYSIQILGIFYLIGCLVYLVIKYENNTRNITEKISQEINTILSDNEKFLTYLGNLIISAPGQDASNIYLILKNINNLNYKSLTTSYVSWADSVGKIIVSGKSGIIDNNHVNIRSRDYFQEIKKEPWKLKVAKIDKSIFSNKIILPTAMGVDTDGKLKGFLVLGLIHNELINYIKESIRNEYYDFHLYINNNLSLSSGNDISINNEKHVSCVSQSSLLFSRFRLIDSHNARVVVGMNIKNFVIWMLGELLGFLSFLFVFLAIYYFRLYKNLIEKALDLAVEKKPIDIIEPPILRGTSKSILSKIQKLKDSVENESSLLEIISSNFKFNGLSIKEKEKYLEKGHERLKENLSLVLRKIQSIRTSDKSYMETFREIENDIGKICENEWLDQRVSTVNVNTLIEESLTFHLIKIRDLQIKIKRNLKPQDLFVVTDQDVLKNMIITVLGYFAASMPEKGEIHIQSEKVDSLGTCYSRVIFRYQSISPIDPHKFTMGSYSKAIRTYSETFKEMLHRSRKLRNIKCYYIQKDTSRGEFVMELLKDDASFDSNVVVFNSPQVR